MLTPWICTALLSGPHVVQYNVKRSLAETVTIPSRGEAVAAADAVNVLTLSVSIVTRTSELSEKGEGGEQGEEREADAAGEANDVMFSQHEFTDKKWHNRHVVLSCWKRILQTHRLRTSKAAEIRSGQSGAVCT